MDDLVDAAVMAAVVSSVISCFMPGGKRCSTSAIAFLTACWTWRAFEPGSGRWRSPRRLPVQAATAL